MTPIPFERDCLRGLDYPRCPEIILKELGESRGRPIKDPTEVYGSWSAVSFVVKTGTVIEGIHWSTLHSIVPRTLDELESEQEKAWQKKFKVKLSLAERENDWVIAVKPDGLSTAILFDWKPPIDRLDSTEDTDLDVYVMTALGAIMVLGSGENDFNPKIYEMVASNGLVIAVMNRNLREFMALSLSLPGRIAKKLGLVREGEDDILYTFSDFWMDRKKKETLAQIEAPVAILILPRT